MCDREASSVNRSLHLVVTLVQAAARRPAFWTTLFGVILTRLLLRTHQCRDSYSEDSDLDGSPHRQDHGCHAPLGCGTPVLPKSAHILLRSPDHTCSLLDNGPTDVA